MSAKQWALGAATLLILTAGCLTAAYRVAYSDMPWSGDPLRIRWCARTFERGDDPAPWHRRDLGPVLTRVMRSPPIIGHSVYTDLPPSELDEAEKRGGVGCLTTGLFLKTGHDTYVGYTLLGGL